MIDIINFLYLCNILKLNIKNKNTQSIFLLLIMGIYFLLPSISQHIHIHNHTFNEINKKDSHHQTENESHGCISCHFMETGNALPLSEFTFEIKKTTYTNSSIPEYYSSYEYNTEISSSSRAPPYS